jgi:hypothetical protein
MPKGTPSSPTGLWTRTQAGGRRPASRVPRATKGRCPTQMKHPLQQPATNAARCATPHRPRACRATNHPVLGPASQLAKSTRPPATSLLENFPFHESGTVSASLVGIDQTAASVRPATEGAVGSKLLERRRCRSTGRRRRCHRWRGPCVGRSCAHARRRGAAASRRGCRAKVCDRYLLTLRALVQLRKPPAGARSGGAREPGAMAASSHPTSATAELTAGCAGIRSPTRDIRTGFRQPGFRAGM